MFEWKRICLKLSLVFGEIANGHARVANLLKIKNVMIIGIQTDPWITGMSRDGGMSVLMNERVLWLFDDTTLASESGQLLNFVSNSAAVGSDSNNVTILQDISLPAAASSNQGDPQRILGSDIATHSDGWISLESNEANFNLKQTEGNRIAICRSIVPFPRPTESIH